MKFKALILFLLGIFILMTVSGCMPGDEKYNEENPAGFFWGIWHGWIAPISLIIGLFNKTTRIYEVFNKGWLYDFGFYIAVISGFGSISIFRKKKSK